MKPRTILLSIYLSASILCGISLGHVITGCTTTQQQSALANLIRLGQVVDAGYQEYLGLAAAGVVPTNNVSQITQHYAEFHAILAAVQHLTVVAGPPPPQVQLSNSVNQLQILVKAEKAKRIKK